MSTDISRFILPLALLLLVFPSNSSAQNGGATDVTAALASWVALDAPPGREHLATDTILNIPLQVGATNGGTDGSDFVRYGALHVGLSWPGRYSHSPVEVLDLRDLQALERLVYAIAMAP